MLGLGHAEKRNHWLNLSMPFPVLLLRGDGSTHAAAGLFEGPFLAAKGRKHFLPAPTQAVLCNCAQEACLRWDRFNAARSVAVS
jgi:hypothetical protein